MAGLANILMLYIAPILVGIGAFTAFKKQEKPDGTPYTTAQAAAVGVVAAVVLHLAFRFVF